jgi:FkbM family methyltransferase
VERFVFGSPEYESDMREHEHERGERQFLESIAEEGMIAVDVGGQYGPAACAISRAIGERGKLYCFEPVPEYREILEENIKASGLINVEVIPAAVGQEAGRTTLHIDGGATSVAPKEGKKTVTADVVRLDDFFAERGVSRLDLLSMDCEGSELFVLQGTSGLLAKSRVRVFAEIHHDFLKVLGLSARDVVRFLEGLEYEVSSVSLSDLSLGRDWEACDYVYARR